MTAPWLHGVRTCSRVRCARKHVYGRPVSWVAAIACWAAAMGEACNNFAPSTRVLVGIGPAHQSRNLMRRHA